MKKIKQLIKFFYTYLIPEFFLKLLLNSNPKNFKKNNIYFWQILCIKKKIESNSENIFLKNNSKIGIVIQGQIIKDNNYTYETLLFLKKYANNSEIILSTWQEENLDEIEKIENLGIKVLKNRKPIQGIENLNFQIYSTKKGIEYFLPNPDITYIMKLRTDQRINLIDFEQKLVSLLQEFPVDKSSEIQKKRIIGLDINTPKYIPFSFCDMFQFGDKQDLNLFWSVELTLEQRSFQERKEKNPKIGDMYNYFDPEIYLYKNFLNKTNFQIENSLQSSLKSLKERFLILDSEMLYFHWFKYYSGKKIGDKNTKKCYETFRFLDWLELYINFKNINFVKLKNIEKEVFEEKFF